MSNLDYHVTAQKLSNLCTSYQGNIPRDLYSVAKMIVDYCKLVVRLDVESICANFFFIGLTGTIFRNLVINYVEICITMSNLQDVDPCVYTKCTISLQQ